MASQAEKARLMDEQQERIRANLETIRHRIVVFSGKGGVGKTTVAVNLACALAKEGLRVGLLDADITGPDVPKMTGIELEHPTPDGGRILPPERFGMKIISLAMLTEPDAPILWRGPMRSRALDQFLGDVVWGDLDYLVADLPPGTGDEVMTMAQHMKPQMAVVVTTPQEMSLIDSRRAIRMAKTMGVPKIGIVENMAGLTCPECGHFIEVFGIGGGERLARELGVRFLGRISIGVSARELADQGRPFVLENQHDDPSREMLSVAHSVMEAAA